MSLDGAGTYQPPAPFFPAIPDTTILSNDFNQIILDIATALSMAIFRDGQAAFTANQSHGGFKITNLANGTAPQDAVTVLQAFTDPTFIGTTANGTQITGTALKTVVQNALISATVLLDMSASGEVKLPANTSIGTIIASELAVLDGLTASTAELNILDGVTASTAEINLLDGVIISTAKLNALATVTVGEIGWLAGVTSPIQTQLDQKVGAESPVFTGIPRAPTAAPYTATTQLATTEFVMGQTMLDAALPFYLMNNAGII